MSRNIFKPLVLMLVLMVAWLLWSGIYTPLLLALGSGSCILALYFAYRIHYFDPEVFSLHVIPRLPRYWGWLFVEIVKSSFTVARIILQRHMPISPTVVEFEAGSTDPVSQVMLGNSITLTPGAVTLDVHAGKLLVHCLTKEGAEELLSGEFNKRATALTARQ